MNFNNSYRQVVLPERAFEIQNAQYRDRILLSGTALAGSAGGADFSQNVSNEGHFLLQYITGTFETLFNTGAIVDTGVTYLSGQLRDGSKNLFSARIPLDCLLTPGRRKSVNSTTVITDPVGNFLNLPLDFQHLYAVNTNITMNIASTSNTNLNFEIVFHGLRIVSSAAADVCRRKAASLS